MNIWKDQLHPRTPLFFRGFWANLSESNQDSARTNLPAMPSYEAREVKAKIRSETPAFLAAVLFPILLSRRGQER